MRNNLPNITSVRFFLAILVVIFHAMPFAYERGLPSYLGWAILKKGPEAVYAFFALSGFLIIRNLFMEKSETGTVSLENFYKRRALRIFPLYYFVLFFGLLYYNHIVPFFGFQFERHYSYFQAILLGGTFFSNVLRNLEPGGIIEVLWSIGIEEQFYLLIAPCFFLFSKIKTVWILVIFSIVYFIFFNFQFLEFLKKNLMYFYFFSISGLFAIFTVIRPNFKIPFFFKIIIYVITLFYFLSNWFLESVSDWVYQLVSALLFPLLIICLISKPISFLENKILIYLGKISYGIYMLHLIVLQVTGFFIIKCVPFNDIAKPIFITGYLCLNIFVSVLFAHLSYQYFEKFFLKFGQKKED